MKKQVNPKDSQNSRTHVLQFDSQNCRRHKSSARHVHEYFTVQYSGTFSFSKFSMALNSRFCGKKFRRKSIDHDAWDQEECIHLDRIFDLRTSQERQPEPVYLNLTFNESSDSESLFSIATSSDGKELEVIPFENLEEKREIEDLEDELLCQTIKLSSAERNNENRSFDHRLQASFLQNLLGKGVDEVFEMLFPV
jgi:hypothetical protein